MLRPPPGYCIPNGIRPAVASADAAQIRQRLGIPDDAKVVLQVARLQRTKGQDLLLKAAPLVLQSVPDAYFLICGYEQRSPEYKAELETDIRSLGIQKSAQVISYPGPIGDIWAMATLHAHPTRLDSSPISILEAMSLGIPSVTTRIGGIPELVADSETGIVVAPDRVTELAGAIVKLLSDPDSRTRLGAKARDLYTRKHTPAAMAAATERVFNSVLRDGA
jgi:glycosyltransferase involved in cell wall biosynthesis